MKYSTEDVHNRIKKLLYSLTGITLTENKDIMISNRIDKLKRNCNNYGDIMELLDSIEKGVFVTEFINTFTTNKTHFFREDFHFEDLRDRVLPNFSSSVSPISIWCSAASTGEEPYSIAMTIIETNNNLNSHLKANIIATDIDTGVLQYAADGIYRFSKAEKEFPDWIKPQKYFRRRVQSTLTGEEILIKANDDLKRMISFSQMNLNDNSYPFPKNNFDVIFCRNVLIYFSVEDQNKILKKLFNHLKIGGTLYLGHSENPQDLIHYVQRVGQNIFIKEKDL
ncbi:Chemotaxis protein methyltransferase [Aliarcobacter thereius]|uniref:protein-glutamate O-methyltransferase n=2 Tax=Aliarcobacter thereius TaxID=544718 RepID=A0A1C0B6X4_9BACT|nr:protein-glutamate O-methyltransferase CheR [Aliarcobacter thereius]OCL86963.1 Chemotaxis protein methyltransferase [Aliarcobacter thereius]OCL91144.1 Chemotaxis protein methyltransferase [Aliarcobacter thereius]OCL96003.1 Chemotaxis protein methyltransferase [Aliarcobacter thereius LMG 24486]OCL99334.1 Chemotaxis protein methyltransferase [Aliarcobacter thereius]QBF16025.1 MCP protein methyltransferase [Aliarcobacter thereius LMG 24486]